VEATHHEEGLHFIFLLGGNFVNVDNTGISASLDAAMLFDCLENLPSLLSVARITGQPKGYE
jgi:hypothetical protein